MKQTERRPPDFFIVGAPKSGTTALYHILGQHPALFLPTKKEPLYFCGYKRNFQGPGAEWQNANLVTDQADYVDLFKQAPPGAMTGEASTDYLACPKAALRIKAWNRDAKIIIVLRNPIDRAYSEHMHLVRDLRETESFIEALRLEPQRIDTGYIPLFWHLRRSLYYMQARRYIETFGRDNVRIFLYDELQTAPDKVISSILSFLGQDNIKLDTSQNINRSGLPTSIWLQRVVLGEVPVIMKLSKVVPRILRNRVRMGLMSANLARTSITRADYHFLLDQLRPDIMSLQQFLNIDLSAWLTEPSV